MSNLKLSDVTKVYPSGSTALYNVNLEAAEREFIVVVGGEKCGKSTLLRIIAGLEEPTSGIVEIGEKDVTEVEPKDRDVAMIFRQDTLYPALSVFDNMAFGLKLRKAPQALIEQRVKAAANILGLTDVLYRKPKALTSAARQRVAIGRAMVREPKIYLFDEPLAGLDEKLRSNLLGLIVNVQARMQGTFVYATKNLSEALTIGTRIVVLKNGFVQQSDSPANLYDYPANTYVAFFIGSPTINFIQHAKVTESDGGFFLEFEGGRLPLEKNILDRFENVSEYAGTDKTVIIGIRPEDASLSADGDIKGKVGKVESDGSNTYCELTCGKFTLVVKANGAKSGEEACASVDCSRLYLFDSESRLTLLKRDGGYIKSENPAADRAPLDYREEQEISEKLKPEDKDKKKKRR